MSNREGIVFNHHHVQAVRLTEKKCDISFPLYQNSFVFGSNLGYYGTYRYKQGTKEFEECMRVYSVLKKREEKKSYVCPLD